MNESERNPLSSDMGSSELSEIEAGVFFKGTVDDSASVKTQAHQKKKLDAAREALLEFADYLEAATWWREASRSGSGKRLRG